MSGKAKAALRQEAAEAVEAALVPMVAAMAQRHGTAAVIAGMALILGRTIALACASSGETLPPLLGAMADLMGRQAGGVYAARALEAAPPQGHG